MSHSMKDLGRFVQQEVDAATDSEKILYKAKQRLDARSRGARRRNHSASWAFAAAAAVAIVSGSYGYLERGKAKTEPNVVSAVTEEEAPVGQWVTARQETRQLSFTDGTELSLHAESRVRIEATTPSGATVRLGRGRTLAKVKPRLNSNWRFVAGPFLVQVTGTEFDLAWDPETRVLELAMHQGKVVLSGPEVAGEREVRKGEFVRVALDEGAMNASATTEAEEEAEKEVDQRTTAEEEEESLGQTGVSVRSAETDGVDEEAAVERGRVKDADISSSTKNDWRSLLASNRTNEALLAIEKEGRQTSLQSATQEELWNIARAARLGGRPRLAQDALLTLRKTHGSRGQTSFLLGKVNADQLYKTSKAITWFETYLKEAPGGPLAEQAMGRLVELQRGTTRGTRAARRYLERYPQGSYAEFCRSLL